VTTPVRALLVVLLAPFAFANTPPATPSIVEPGMELQALNGADVHMVASQFIDLDGDDHRCTDWEIRDAEELIWSAPCAAGPLKLHIHLGDGVFTGNHTNVQEVRADSRFSLRVRYRDDSGDEETEWSGWTTRTFQTVKPSPVEPMRLFEVLPDPAPRWTVDGDDVVVPPGAALELQTVDGQSLLRMNASGNAYAPQSIRAVIRLRIASGATEWNVPRSELLLHGARGQSHTIYLPAMTLAPNTESFYWISSNGGTHAAADVDRTPDFSEIARGAPVPWTFETGYRGEVFATGFALPVSLVAVPNPGAAPDSPLLYVAELYGSVKVVTRSGEVRTFASGLLNFDPLAPIPGNGERGLGGITIDPANGDVIVTAIFQVDPTSPWTSPRVLRLQSDDGGFTAARVITVVDFPGEAMAPSHQISNVTFGPDDKMYVHIGSSFAWIAQELNNLDGKIIRINRDGSVPTDNPFYDASDGITAKDYVFAYGFRNPFGGAWRIADGSLYEVENGPATDRLAIVVAGRNYLWDGSDPSMKNFAIYNWTFPVAPIQIAFTEAERFGGSGFPIDRMRSAFVTESGATWASGPQEHGKRISEFVFDPDGALVSGPKRFAEYNGSGKATAAGLVAGPDGLYFTDLYRDFGQSTPADAGANVIRVRWIGIAAFDARFLHSSAVALTDFSDVPDATSIEWDFGDGTTSNERNPVHRYQRPGTYLIQQTVTGPRGSVTETRRVSAGGSAGTVEAQYFENAGETEPVVVRPEHSMHFDWRKASPDPDLGNGFAAQFVVRVKPRFSETYRFVVQTHDRVRLELDGKLLIDAWEPDASGESRESIGLIAGRTYELRIDYEDHSEQPSLRVLWESESQPLLVVPQSVSNGKRRAVGH